MSVETGFDGGKFICVVRDADGVETRSVRLALGSHTDAEHDAAVAQMRQAYAGLRQWSLDAQAAFDTWPTKTAAQKDATNREVIRRLGVFFDRFADLLTTLNADQ